MTATGETQFIIADPEWPSKIRNVLVNPIMACLKPLKSKGSIGHAFTVCIRTENQNQVSFCPFAPREVSVLAELTLGHLRCSCPWPWY